MNSGQTCPGMRVCAAVAVFLMAPAATLAQVDAQSHPAVPFVLPALDPAISPEPRPAVAFQKVEFNGNTVVPTHVLEAMAEPYLQRPVSADELEDLRLQLTRYYIDRGYVNSGVLRRDDAAAGVLSFRVVEGRLGVIRLTGAAALDSRYITRRLATAADGPFNMEVLRERFQLTLADPLIARMNARLLPGEKPGEAALDVDVSLARPYQFTVFANNYRPPSIGSNAIGFSGVFRNLAGIGDVFEASLQNVPPSGAIGRSSISWNTPLGWGGTRFSVSLDHGDSSLVEQPAAALGISSHLRSLDVGVSHALAESLTHDLTLGLNHMHRESRTLLMGSPFSFTANEPEGTIRESLLRFWQDYRYHTPTQVLALRSSFTMGHNNLIDVAEFPVAGSAARRAAKSFVTWLGQVQWARKVADSDAQLVARATVQHSADHLLALDGLSVGGINSVRGFRENALVRDAGEYINLEFDYPLPRDTLSGVHVNLIPFIDYGAARDQDGHTGTLASAGLAARLVYKGLHVDLVLARRLQELDTTVSTRGSLQDAGIHLQIACKF